MADALQLLSNIQKSDTMDVTKVFDYLCREYEMNERQKYIDQHDYRIYQGKDGLWYTYVPDESKRDEGERYQSYSE